MGAIVLVGASKEGVVVNNGQNMTSGNEEQTKSTIGTPAMEDPEETVRSEGVILDYETLRGLIRENANFKILISENEIEDKAKGDFLTPFSKCLGLWLNAWHDLFKGWLLLNLKLLRWH